MLTMVVIAAVKSGQEGNFAAQITKLAELIATEPGSRGITWGPTETPGEYAVVERYADKAALEAHRASTHMKAHGRDLVACFAKPANIVRFIEQRDL